MSHAGSRTGIPGCIDEGLLLSTWVIKHLRVNKRVEAFTGGHDLHVGAPSAQNVEVFTGGGHGVPHTGLSKGGNLHCLTSLSIEGIYGVHGRLVLSSTRYVYKSYKTVNGV